MEESPFHGWRGGGRRTGWGAGWVVLLLPPPRRNQGQAQGAQGHRSGLGCTLALSETWKKIIMSDEDLACEDSKINSRDPRFSELPWELSPNFLYRLFIDCYNTRLIFLLFDSPERRSRCPIFCLNLRQFLYINKNKSFYIYFTSIYL